jgi:hypothetical protein
MGHLAGKKSREALQNGSRGVRKTCAQLCQRGESTFAYEHRGPFEKII